MWPLDEMLYGSMSIVSYVLFGLKREFPVLVIPLPKIASLVCLQFLQGTRQIVEWSIPEGGMYELEEKHHLNIIRRQSYTADKCELIFILTCLRGLDSRQSKEQLAQSPRSRIRHLLEASSADINRPS
jgi:hypothetical protein